MKVTKSRLKRKFPPNQQTIFTYDSKWLTDTKADSPHSQDPEGPVKGTTVRPVAKD